MPDASASPELRRLRWRCRRGMRELDVLLMTFLDAEYGRLAPAERRGFEDFLRLPDPEILDLLMGRMHSHDPAVDAIVGRILARRAG